MGEIAVAIGDRIVWGRGRVTETGARIDLPGDAPVHVGARLSVAGLPRVVTFIEHRGRRLDVLAAAFKEH